MSTPKNIKEIQLVFYHGWGFTKEFFTPLLEFLKEYQCIVQDTGYFGESEYQKITGNYIAIGHSLGFLKILENEVQNCKAVVGINSFLDFCASKEQSFKLEKMITAFTKNPHATLKSFYQKCGVRYPLNYESLNYQRLSEDLSYLNTAKFKFIKNKPSIFFSTQDDGIIDIKQAKREFNTNLVIIPKGGHGLGYNLPQLIGDSLKNFVKKYD